MSARERERRTDGPDGADGPDRPDDADGADGPDGADGHIMRELGLELARSGEEVHGRAPVRPEMWVPGATSLRVSILAAWADILTGYVAVDVLEPRVPVTLELDLNLYRPAPGEGTVHMVAGLLKSGRAVTVASVEVTGGAGEPVAVGSASFMAAPNQHLTLPPRPDRWEAAQELNGRLRVPFAERARCTRREPGVAALPRSEDGLNASDTINGGLLALAAEEAALSLTPGRTLSTLGLRYLRPARVGPAVATARVLDGLGRVEVRDAGNEDRLTALATTRTFGVSRPAGPAS